MLLIFNQKGECIVTRGHWQAQPFDKAVGASIRMSVDPRIIGLSGKSGVGTRCKSRTLKH